LADSASSNTRDGLRLRQCIFQASVFCGSPRSWQSVPFYYPPETYVFICKRLILSCAGSMAGREQQATSVQPCDACGGGPITAETSTKRLPLFNLMVQAIGVLAALMFGVWAPLSWQLSRISNHEAQRANEIARMANKLDIINICLSNTVRNDYALNSALQADWGRLLQNLLSVKDISPIWIKDSTICASLPIFDLTREESCSHGLKVL
jgi:hypothetical protein